MSLRLALPTATANAADTRPPRRALNGRACPLVRVAASIHEWTGGQTGIQNGGVGAQRSTGYGLGCAREGKGENQKIGLLAKRTSASCACGSWDAGGGGGRGVAGMARGGRWFWRGCGRCVWEADGRSRRWRMGLRAVIGYIAPAGHTGGCFRRRAGTADPILSILSHPARCDRPSPSKN